MRRAAEQEAEAAAKVSAKTITDNEERLRREKLQKESDLELAMETFGVSDSSGGGGGGLESSNPSTDEDFTSFGNSLTDLIVKFEVSCGGEAKHALGTYHHDYVPRVSNRGRGAPEFPPTTKMGVAKPTLQKWVWPNQKFYLKPCIPILYAQLTLTC